jgi:hypothetical protein
MKKKDFVKKSLFILAADLMLLAAAGAVAVTVTLKDTRDNVGSGNLIPSEGLPWNALTYECQDQEPVEGQPYQFTSTYNNVTQVLVSTLLCWVPSGSGSGSGSR